MVQIYKAKKNKPNQTHVALTVTIDSLDHHGNGIVRQHKPVMVITGALPGETCNVIITQQKKRVWLGYVQSVLNAHEQRQSPFCPHYSACGGCQLQHVTSHTALQLKQDAIHQLLTRSLNTDIEWADPIDSTPTRYRRKARLAIDARNKDKVLLGFRGANNKVVSITQCDNLEPSLQALIAPLNVLVNAMQFPTSIGHITLLVSQQQTVVSIRVTKTLNASDKASIDAFALTNDCVVEQETTSKQEQQNHSKWSYTVCDDISIQFSTNDFIQVNAVINKKMINRAIEWLSLESDDIVLDLFCGVGNFSLPIAKHVKHVQGIEGMPHMVAQATENTQLNDIQNVTFHHEDLSQTDVLKNRYLASCNKMLLDPARDGAMAIMSQLKHSALTHVLYVSCSTDSFTRDANVLCDNGFKLVRICVMDMFPNTAHTETMALFVRAK